MRGADELLLAETHVVLVIDYPLDHPFDFPIDAPGARGFTRADLLAARVVAASTEAIRNSAGMPDSSPMHPDIPGSRFIALRGFPYLVFYTVTGPELVVLAVEYATRDYVARVTARVERHR